MDVPIWEKYTLTIEEAALYFRIGESKLRKILSDFTPNELNSDDYTVLRHCCLKVAVFFLCID